MGITYGAYDILEELPSWTAGIAYRARNRATGEIVALKIMDMNAVEEDDKRSFYEIASKASTLNHKNIARIIDVCKRVDNSVVDGEVQVRLEE